MHSNVINRSQPRWNALVSMLLHTSKPLQLTCQVHHIRMSASRRTSSEALTIGIYMGYIVT